LLDRLKDGSNVDASTLAAAGFVKKAGDRVKLLATGKLTKKLSVKVHGASSAAKAAIEAAGGTLEIVTFVNAPSKKATRPKSTEQAKV
jgi:large subunit ribosomal protein L15